MSKTTPRNHAAVGEAPDAQPKTYKDLPLIRQLYEALTALRGGGFCGMIIAGMILAEVPTGIFESVSNYLRRLPGKWTGYGAWIDYAPVLIPYVVLLILTGRHFWNRVRAKGKKDILVWVALIVLCIIPINRLYEVRAKADEAANTKDALATQIYEAVRDGVSMKDKALAARIDELSRQVDLLKGANRVQGPHGQPRP